ncbi:unnamed protein product [Wuchereria bancrofti]|uniref:Uncharacterized protein n=1 Tax=Wuchereria bancrofti TaxID=6293 RepID=A0A3P7GDF8_WUCBA|nr:unnamed protein product [Wuchereria bancrofti]
MRFNFRLISSAIKPSFLLLIKNYKVEIKFHYLFSFGIHLIGMLSGLNHLMLAVEMIDLFSRSLSVKVVDLILRCKYAPEIANFHR